MSVLVGPSPRRALSDRAAPCPSIRCRVEAAAPVLGIPFVTLPDAACCAHLEPQRTAHGWAGACSCVDGAPARGTSASGHTVLA
jgi:hypothetical protein